MSGSHSKSTFRVSINVSLVPVPVLCTGRLFQPLGQTSCEGERLLLVAGHYGVPSFFFPPGGYHYCRQVSRSFSGVDLASGLIA